MVAIDENDGHRWSMFKSELMHHRCQNKSVSNTGVATIYF